MKFFIASAPRTGSSHLRYLLNSHPDIICKGEIFNANPCKDFRKILAKQWKNKAAAVGFKLLYHQADILYPGLWEHLKKDGIKMIHLMRRNVLDIVLSEKLAKLHGYYISFNSKDIYKKQVVISPEEIEAKKAYLDEVVPRINTMFDPLKIYYEDIENNIEACKPLVEFLGLEWKPLKPKTVKLTTSRDLIVNYNDLRLAGY